MIVALRKTSGRTGRFLGRALACRGADRAYAAVAWGLVAGAVWLAADLRDDPAWTQAALAGIYLLAVLAAICAIDAGYGIIPDSLVAAVGGGGLVQAFLAGQAGLLERGLEALAILTAGKLLRACYRRVRGFDGLGLGDVKFLTAAVFWVGLREMPTLLLVGVVSAMISLVIMRAEGHQLDGRQAISFGPHLAVGLWLTWIAGPLLGGL